MTTTTEWINKVLMEDGYLEHWLQRQFVGEINAARRVHEFALSSPEKYAPVLFKIAQDELKHAQWVLDLLESRNIPIPTAKDKATAEVRYWEPILKHAQDFDTTAAAGYHAEGMRLNRIRALVADERIDQDIREVFAKILPDEIFHEKAFGAMASEAAKVMMADKHEEGLARLGLEI